jgi:hypothetical protein
MQSSLQSEKVTPYVETTCALLSVVYVSAAKSLPDFHAIWCIFSLKDLSGKCKFRETQLSENLALFMGVYEFLPIL